VIYIAYVAILADYNPLRPEEFSHIFWRLVI